MQKNNIPIVPRTHSRRRFLGDTAALAATAMLAPAIARAQNSVQQGTPPSVVTHPARQWGPGAPPMIYPDPDILIVDPSFKDLTLGLTAIQRVATGFRWAEGPAWSGQGRYFVFSDVDFLRSDHLKVAAYPG